MRKLIAATIAAVLALSTSLVALAGTGTTGNGGPSGPHYNLNIIGTSDKSAEMTDSNRHVIFVKLQGQTKINLTEGDFRVLDGNGTDGTAAFQLPDPDSDGNGITAYSVYARALGKPGGGAVATTCFTDAADETWCSTESVVLVRGTGKSRFDNVSKELLTVCVDWDLNGSCDQRVFLFDDANYDFYWQYDNNGLRLAQLRFYEIPTNVGLNP